MLSSRLYLCGKAASYCDEISQAPEFKRRVSFELYAVLLRYFCLLQNEQVQAFIGSAEYFEQKKPVKPKPIADKSLNSGKY